MKGLRVLVVDDEPGVRDCFVRMLRYRDCEVQAVQNAKEAFAALRHGPRYDVVLVDLVMPEMAGLPMIREMKAMDRSLHFVVVSGKLISNAERMDLVNLAVGFCAKPFRNKDVLQSVEAAARREEHPGVVNAFA